MPRAKTKVKFEVGDWVTVDTSTWRPSNAEHKQLWEGVIVEVVGTDGEFYRCRTLYPLSDHPNRGLNGFFGVDIASLKLFMKKSDLMLDKP